MRRFIQAHLALVSAGAIFLVIAIAFVMIWFQPQKLFIEKSVDEALPTAVTNDVEPSSSPKDPSSASSRPAVLARGRFQSLEHTTTGTAQLLELADGTIFLRLEDLDTSNGPDLRVYLSEIPASNDWYAYRERFVDLGALKGNRGDQNYQVPDGTDLSRYKSAVIWCRRFTVGFGVAGLE